MPWAVVAGSLWLTQWEVGGGRWNRCVPHQHNTAQHQHQYQHQHQRHDSNTTPTLRCAVYPNISGSIQGVPEYMTSVPDVLVGVRSFQRMLAPEHVPINLNVHHNQDAVNQNIRHMQYRKIHASNRRRVRRESKHSRSNRNIYLS